MAKKTATATKIQTPRYAFIVSVNGKEQTIIAEMFRYYGEDEGRLLSFSVGANDVAIFNKWDYCIQDGEAISSSAS
jgi:hypothetical protein